MEELEMELDAPVDDPASDFNVMSAENDLDGNNTDGAAQLSTVVGNISIDLDSYPKIYTGYALMNRLLFISDVCPQLRPDALRLLIDYVTKNTQNVAMLNAAYSRVDKAKQLGQTAGLEKIPPLESWGAWIEQTCAKAQNQLDARLADFNRQKDEAVKESIRRSVDELFHQYVHMGKVQEALKLYARGMREYCSGPNYVLQMLINWINATVYVENWNKLETLIPQAERAISEIADREGTNDNRSGAVSGTTAMSSKDLSEKKAKIKAISGLCGMQRKDFKSAAEAFINVDTDVLDYPEALTAEDVAIYGALCSLATFSRSELKNRLMSSALYRRFLESDPKMVDLLQKFCHSEFGTCFDTLNSMKDKLLLNIYLSPHVNTLYEKIRQSVIVQYFQPYLSLSIESMANELRTDVNQLEDDLVMLIDNGSLKARIDSCKKILYAKFDNGREEVLKRAFDSCNELSHHVNSILLRAALVNHKIVVGRAEGSRGEARVQKRRGQGNSRVLEEDDGEDDDEDDVDITMDLS